MKRDGHFSFSAPPKSIHGRNLYRLFLPAHKESVYGTISNHSCRKSSLFHRKRADLPENDQVYDVFMRVGWAFAQKIHVKSESFCQATKHKIMAEWSVFSIFAKKHPTMRFLNAILCVILFLTACTTSLPELHETVLWRPSGSISTVTENRRDDSLP